MPTKYQGSKREVDTLNAFIKLTRASESINNRLSRCLACVNLTVSQFGILEALLHIGPQSQKELGSRILKSGGNITLVIDNLEKQGYVKKEKDPRDGRAVIISLSKKGEEFITGYFPKHLQHIVNEFEVLSSEELMELGRLAKKVGNPEK